MTTPWQYRYALRTEGMGSSIIRELLKLTEQPDMISFAGGLPAPELFPVEQFRRGIRQGACRDAAPRPCSTAPPRAICRCAA